MKKTLELLGLRAESDWMTTEHRSFRPPSWPPPRDWIVSEDQEGNVLSRWGDQIWDISPWAGRSMILDFGDGPCPRMNSRLDSANADVLRLLATWRIWGIKACRKASTLKETFQHFKRIVVLCNQNGIVATELMRFPRVLDKISGIFAPSAYPGAILELHRIWDARDHLGFVLVDESGIKRLAQAISQYEKEQTAYIPPRIWTYQVQRLRECLDDYLQHQEKFEKCFQFCVDAYSKKFGSLEAAFTKKVSRVPPFTTNWRHGRKVPADVGEQYLFGAIAERFGINVVMEKWLGIPIADLEVRSLSSYCSLVQYAGLSYIANFTLQRISEAASLRSDCLIWENDEKLGRIPIIVGETTKTDTDSDARWPTSPSVSVAITAMRSIASMRMVCAAENPSTRPTLKDKANPYLLSGVYEPWAAGSTEPYSIRPHLNSYKALRDRFPLLFDEEKLRITEDDLRIARQFTPNLSKSKGFEVGEIWPLAWHQLRRTGAVNMFSSGILSDSSIQFLMKHSSRLMPLYYGRGFTKLHINEEVEGIIVNAVYQAMADNLQAAMDDRFVSPRGQSRKDVVLFDVDSVKTSKALVLAARQGLIHYREMRVGCCTHRGPCSFGGVESISRCTGGDGKAPCLDALYDREKAPLIERDLVFLEADLANSPVNSPRHKALLAERKGLEYYLNVVRK